MDFLSDPTKRVLDYGCGRGYDADRLGMFKYDPHFFDDKPAGTFHHVYCGYVLNTIDAKEGQAVIDEIKALLKPKGCGYVVVRRDQKNSNTNQRNVTLENAITFTSNSKYTIYSIWRDKEVTVR
jgi:2-polyprenyl-3-methyl-5-hydroxy-6-metoxy-1,4-benzoquinol methylase